MTPKEKAKELYFKMHSQEQIVSKEAKQCALIAANELIYFSSNQSLSVDFDGDYYCDHDFFVEVKKQIEAL
jgi:hypothetical protein